MGGLAQLGEHLLCKQGVVGSIPSSSTICLVAVWVRSGNWTQGNFRVNGGLVQMRCDAVCGLRCRQAMAGVLGDANAERLGQPVAGQGVVRWFLRTDAVQVVFVL